MSKISSFLKDESGVTAAEYGLILALVAGAITIAFSGLATSISNAVTTVAGKITVS